MRVTFLVPSRGSSPSGGIKVIYEYASGLARLGHEVTVVHFLPRSTNAPHVRRALYIAAKAIGIDRAYGAQSWMPVEPNVRIRLLATTNSAGIPDGDAIVAGTWWLAEAMNDFPLRVGRKYQLIQEYEYFMTAHAQIQQRMARTYQGIAHNIVISPACRRMVESAGGKVLYEIPNGLSHGIFRLTEPISSPLRKSVGFPSRGESFKRTGDAVEAIVSVRQEVGDAISYWSFGSSRPAGLPDWCRFEQRPSDADLVALHNRSAVFLVPSEYEGWGLPGSEAMCCGAALVSTRNGGVDAYAIDGDNAILVPPRRPDQLAAAVVDLLVNDTKRRTIAEKGHTLIRQLTWKRSIAAMDSALTQLPSS